MTKYVLSLLLLTSTVPLFAQIPEDVIKYSYYPQNGTARSLAIGGAMGSLGGDITAIYVNPAGLGNYKTGEFVFTPGLYFNNNKTTYRDLKDNSKKNNFGLGPIGLVFGSANSYNPSSSTAFSIAFTQSANFNNVVQYKGFNNYSSYSEQWAEQISKSGATFDQVLNDPKYAYGAAPAVYTYLVDTFNVGGGLQVRGLPEFLLGNGHALYQEKNITTKGGMYEVAIGFASNNKDKLLIGGSIGIPILNYNNTTTFRESDTSSKSNNFDYFNYTDNYSTNGVGINLKLGLIYKPSEYIRLGLAMHTPSYMFTMKDKRNTSLEANTEDYNGLASVTSASFTGGVDGESKYTMLTPWRFLISGSYVFREIEDVRKQKGFITADIEYLGYKNSGFYSAAEVPTTDEEAYYKTLNQVIKGQYKGNFNFRVGGELKFNVVMARLGFAYYTNPYKDAELKASRMLVSGGVGYRHKGFFVDLTYVHSFNKDVDFAYRLADKNNTFATINNQRGNLVASVGIKF